MDTLFSDVESVTDISSSSEDYEDIESLYSGHALNDIFSGLEETISKIDDLLAFERGFSHGDVVSLASDPSGPTGKVVSVSLTVDLEDLNGHRIKNVDSKDLRKPRTASVGDYVVRGAHIGKVKKITEYLTILFDDGTKGNISPEGPGKITSLSPEVIEDPNCNYFPGQRVLVEYPSSVLTSSTWLCGNGGDNGEELGTICNVEAGAVYIDWLHCAFAENDEQRQRNAPSSLQELKDLIFLPGFSSHANWQLGDWCVLGSERGLGDQHVTAQHVGSAGSDFQRAAVVVKTRTKVDVMWQDGSKSIGLDSCLVAPVGVVGGHDFWPEAFVLQKGTVGGDGSRRWGFVRSVDPRERTVTVRWCEPCCTDSCESEEIVSAYELIEHPEYNCLGEIVCRKVDFLDEILAESRTKSNLCEEGDNLKAFSDDFDGNFVSYFGTVVGAEGGSLEVKWTNGDVTKVEPSEICRIDRCEDTSASSFVLPFEVAPPEILGSNDNQNPPEKEKPLSKKLKDIFVLNRGPVEQHSPFSFTEAAVGFFTSITSSLFGSAADAQNPNGGELSIEKDVNVPEKIMSRGTKEANEDNNVRELPRSNFNQFDLLGACSDHHFASESHMDFQSPQTRRCWLRKVRQEWSILEKNLPETIYVRVYEERMQLIRAAIVGPPGTPYHDLLFFFDIYLPPQYPNEPPMVYYNSGGLRINPNLYESGRVCLSLLNTWAGSRCEAWNPESSTILQVLVSIQGLVLNERPYFNEAGFESQIGKPEGEKNSLSYNENAFLVSCRSMLYLLKNPPEGFEELVEEHFNRHGKDFLMACREYMEGAPIGRRLDSTSVEGDLNLKGNSKGFKIVLAKMFPKLVEAFSDKAVDCGDYQVS